MEELQIQINLAKNILEVKTQNLTGHIIRVLKWNTILDFPYEHGFSILKNDVPLQYTGPRYKRAFDAEVSLITFAVEETKSFTYDLVDIINQFDCDEVTTSDIITLTIAKKQAELVTDVEQLQDSELLPDDLKEIKLTANVVELGGNLVIELYKKKIDQTTSSNIEFEQVPLCVFGHNSGWEQQGPTNNHIIGYPLYSGVNATRQAIINKAIKFIFQNKSSLISVSNNALYKRWFGNFTTANKQQIDSTLQKIHKGACPSYIVFDGSGTSRCTADTFAWVQYSVQYNNNARQCSASNHYCHKLFLCSKFWTRPFRGADSQVGTLIHELSHAYAYTNDDKYGKPLCLRYAQTNPNLAIRNADNIEYYCEELLGV